MDVGAAGANAAGAAPADEAVAPVCREQMTNFKARRKLRSAFGTAIASRNFGGGALGGSAADGAPGCASGTCSGIEASAIGRHELVSALSGSGERTRLAEVDLGRADLPPRTIVDAVFEGRAERGPRWPRVADRERGATQMEIERRHLSLVRGDFSRPASLLPKAPLPLDPPSERMWMLLGAWALGGLPLCAHRLLLRSWRHSFVHVASVAVGSTLIGIAASELDPRHNNPDAFEFGAATTVRYLAYGLGGSALGLFLADGRLLHRGELLPRGADPFDWTPWDAPRWRVAFFAWATLGLPLGAHCWVVGHWGMGILEAVVALSAIALGAISVVGGLHAAFGVCLGAGITLLTFAMLSWARDLIQLLRGRLGPRNSPAPVFWGLLGAAALLGPVGGHRACLGRLRSAPLFALGTIAAGLCAADAGIGLTGWKGGATAQTWSIFSAEIAISAVLGLGVSVGIGADIRRILRGALRPRREPALYWRVLYSWLLGGLPLGLHRFAAGKSTWRLYCILNVYGAGLLVLAELGLRPEESVEAIGEIGSPDVTSANATGTRRILGDPEVTSPTAYYLVVGLGCAMIVAVVALWIYDARDVVRGTLPRRYEHATFWSAVHTWLMPTGYICGLHFAALGRPLDWQLYSSFSAIGALCAVNNMLFATKGKAGMTFLLILVAGIGALGLNLLRFVIDGTELRPHSMLSKQLTPSRLARARLLWLLTGPYASLHQWYLGQRVASVLSVALTLLGLTFLAFFFASSSTESAATLTLGVAVGIFGITFTAWVRDGVMLLLGKVDTAGRKLEVLAEVEEPVSPSQLKPPATWRRFQTQAGNYYYYDPDTEIVHYLTKSGASRRLYCHQLIARRSP